MKSSIKQTIYFTLLHFKRIQNSIIEKPIQNNDNETKDIADPKDNISKLNT